MHCDKHIVPNIEYLKYISSRFFENQPTKFAVISVKKPQKARFVSPKGPKFIAKEEKKRRKKNYFFQESLLSKEFMY